MQDNANISTDDMKDKLRDDVKTAQDTMAAAARDQAEAGKEQAAAKVDHLSEAIEGLASSLSDDDKAGLADYAHQASAKLSTLAEHINTSSLDQLAEEARQLARHKPAAFLLGSVALGFGLSRFMKATERRVNGTDHSSAGTYAHARPYADSASADVDYDGKGTDYEPERVRSHPASPPASGVDAIQ